MAAKTVAGKTTRVTTTLLIRTMVTIEAVVGVITSVKGKAAVMAVNSGYIVNVTR